MLFIEDVSLWGFFFGIEKDMDIFTYLCGKMIVFVKLLWVFIRWHSIVLTFTWKSISIGKK